MTSVADMPAAAPLDAAPGEPLSPDVIAKVARLARLDLDDDETRRFTAQLGDMLEHFADIDALQLAGVEPMSQPYPLRNVLRDDVVEPCLDRDEVLAEAPDVDDHRFRVPPIVGIEP